ncbi:MAG: DUF4160 domain-containing protein [Candidatus Methylumidiphilus sp.]
MSEWVISVMPDLIDGLAVEFQNGLIDGQGCRLLTEETVTNFNGLKIQIFSNEHPPPHFRVAYGGETANFSIKDCTKLNGDLKKWERNIRAWHSDNKDKLIEIWNKARPSDCPVGAYRE